MANEIKIEGFSQFIEKLNSLPDKTIRAADAIVYDLANKWAGQAKRSAPVNFGALRGRIQAVKTGLMSAEVVSPTRYSPFVEWGTGSKVNVPSDLVEYAIQFKGRKKILGQNPNAFFFIHKAGIETEMNTRLQKYLNTQQ